MLTTILFIGFHFFKLISTEKCENKTVKIMQTHFSTILFLKRKFHKETIQRLFYFECRKKSVIFGAIYVYYIKCLCDVIIFFFCDYRREIVTKNNNNKKYAKTFFETACLPM